MKKFMPIIVLTLSAFAWSASAQTIKILPIQSAVPHFVLTIGYYKTTVLIFPTAIDTADRGSNEIIAEKQSHLQNVLKVKAAYQGFSPTNLHVFTTDHRLYAFDLVYSDSPIVTTFDLSKVTSPKDSSIDTTTILFSRRPLTSIQWSATASMIKAQPPAFNIRSNSDGIKARLENICQDKGFLVFCIRLTNNSELPFTMAYADMELSDKRKIRRSSVQERQLQAAYSDSLTVIPGKSSLQWVTIIPQFTIPGHRLVRWTVGEDNGSRIISLRIKNRQLFNAKYLSQPD
jgi:conjugative transposon TraN protein